MWRRKILHGHWSLVLLWYMDFKWLGQEWRGGNYASDANLICRDLLKNPVGFFLHQIGMMMRPRLKLDWLKAPCILAFDSVSTVAIWRTEEFEIGACTNIFHWEKYTAAFFAVLHPLSIWQIVTRTFLWATSIDWQSKSPLWYIVSRRISSTNRNDLKWSWSTIAISKNLSKQSKRAWLYSQI